MLSLRKITKNYGVGDSVVQALGGVSLDFRENEFVSILGPSGCGKTTLLNIIGGLDQYTSGDLIINGVSTKQYRDADWDTYRNHSIGFVFQSYNLIPHQTVLANVELALTLSGISKRERRARAKDALRQVGLESQMHKRPNQMSGGQMQRVAIARALVNDPDILLADEPTGALDTQTSVQIMEILREISKKKLIIMVTHNPELASRYSSRIIRVLDGHVINDTNPYYNPDPLGKQKQVEAAQQKKKVKEKKKRSMSFFTALALSFNNLLTKKGRTFMTSFAGSIGIIGIALILSVSTGVNNYINTVQRDTLASYPIQLRAESIDLSSLITSIMGSAEKSEEEQHELDKVYESAVIAELINSLNTAKTNTNDLKSFKKFLESTDKFDPYLTATQYTYNFDWSVFTKDADGKVISSDIQKLFEMMSGGGSSSQGSISSMSSMASSYSIWEEMLPGKDGEAVSDIVKNEYDLIYGSWPKAYNEILLVVDENNEISDLSLYALGLRTEEEIREGMMAAAKGETFDLSELGSWEYEEFSKMNFRLILSSECYQKQADGTYTDLRSTESGMDFLYNNSNLGVNLKIVGILRPNPDATSTILRGSIAYTSALTEHVIDKTQKNDLLKAQKNDPKTDVFTGLPFPDENDVKLTDAEKKAALLDYVATLQTAEKALLFTAIASTPTEEQALTYAAGEVEKLEPEQLTAMLIQAIAAQMGASEDDIAPYITSKTADEQKELAITVYAAQYVEIYKQQMAATLGTKTQDELAAMLDETLASMDEATFAKLYDEYMPKQYSDSTYEKNLFLLGDVDKSSPDGINLYASTFEDKDEIAALIKEYNKTVGEEQEITYTDYVALLMSSVTTIVNAITYVLIAFVAISLVVSSIMIGIITYISVLERTKEIGILRAIGASKRDIGRVFNAETLIIGFVAGMIGILATLFLNIIINIILFHFTGIAALKATLPVVGAIVLVAISMLLTFIAGLFPSGFAAKRNPVEALRSE